MTNNTNDTNNIAYWEFELEGVMSEEQFKDKAQVMRAADEKWVTSVSENNSLRNGETWEDTAALYAMNKDGVALFTEDYEVEYEHYHGDHAEHFHQGDYI